MTTTTSKLAARLFQRDCVEKQSRPEGIELSSLIASARAFVLIMARDLTLEAYHSAHVASAVQAALKKGIRFRILVGPSQPIEGTWFAGVLEHVIFVSDHEPPMDFAVADGTDVWYFGSRTRQKKAPYLYRDAAESAADLIRVFERNLAGASPLKTSEP